MTETMMTTTQWMGGATLVLGIACLWSGGRMGRLLPKPWSGAPRDWLPESRAIIKRSLVVIRVGAVLIIASVASLLWRW